MKKTIFLCVPPDITQEDLNQLRRFYKHHGFIVRDPFALQHDLDNQRVIMPSSDYDEKHVTAYSIQHLAKSDYMVLSRSWMSDKYCQLYVSFAHNFRIPMFEEYTRKKYQVSADFRLKFEGKYTDNSILDSNKREPEYINH